MNIFFEEEYDNKYNLAYTEAKINRIIAEEIKKDLLDNVNNNLTNHKNNNMNNTHICVHNKSDNYNVLDSSTKLGDDEEVSFLNAQGSLKSSIINIQSKLVSKMMNKTIKNEFDIPESVRFKNDDADEEKEDLRLQLVAFYTLIFLLFGKNNSDKVAGKYGLNSDFSIDEKTKSWINSTSEKVADSHINTIINDVNKEIKKSYNESIKEEADKRAASFGRSVNDEDLVYARKTALQGVGRQKLVSDITNKFQDISKGRAEVIARTETNRAFTQSQFQADRQFLEQNGLMKNAYKKWVTRSDNPCVFCVDLSNSGLIPFNNNFVDIGDSIIVEDKVNGKTKIKQLNVNFENLEAGNAHPNCACTYELIIKNDDGTIFNHANLTIDDLDINYNPNRDPATGRFDFGKGQSKVSSSLSKEEAFYNYQDRGYSDINDYLWLSNKIKNKESMLDFEEQRWKEINANKENVNRIKEHIKVMDKTFADEGKTGGYGYRVDNSIAADLFSKTGIGDYLTGLKKDGKLPKNHSDWFDNNAISSEIENKIKSELEGLDYEFKGYISADISKNGAIDRFASGMSKIDPYGFEVHIQLHSDTVKTLDVNEITKQYSSGSQVNPENEILFNRNSSFKIDNVSISLTSAEFYTGEEGEGFVINIDMSDSIKNNSIEKQSNYNPNRDSKTGRFDFGSGISTSKSKSAEKYTKHIDYSIDTLDDLNPTGGIGSSVAYTPELRAHAPLDVKQITTLAETTGKNPDDIIMIYRGSDSKGKQKKIVPGDYITDMKELAESYAGEGDVLSLEVRYGDILDNLSENDSLGNEYIYRPNADKEIEEIKKTSNNSAISLNYNPNRDPATGRFDFGKSGKTSAAKSKSISEEQINNIMLKNNFNMFDSVPGNHNKFVADIFGSLNYDKKPRNASPEEYEKLRDSGDYIPVARGLSDSSKGTAQSFMKQFREGELFVGNGTSGAGTYTMSNPREIGSYASSPDSVQHMLIPKNAKIIDYDDMMGGYSKYTSEKSTKYTNKGNQEAKKKNYDLVGKYSDLGKRYSNLNTGAYAAIHGYDVIKRKLNDGNDMYLILNRGIIIVPEEVI